MLDNNAIVMKFTSLTDALSTASVARKSERTLALLRRRVSDVESDFLEKDDVGRLGSLEDVIEDEFAASGLELRASTFQDTWGRRQLSRWAQHTAQRYGCPATDGVVEGRKGMVESVGEHGGVEMTRPSILFLLVITMKTNNGTCLQLYHDLQH